VEVYRRKIELGVYRQNFAPNIYLSNKLLNNIMCSVISRCRHMEPLDACQVQGGPRWSRTHMHFANRLSVRAHASMDRTVGGTTYRLCAGICALTQAACSESVVQVLLQCSVIAAKVWRRRCCDPFGLGLA